MVLLVIAGGSLGFRVWKGVESRTFQTSVGRLRFEMETCRRLALNMEADWTLTLSIDKNQLIVQRSCPEAGRLDQATWASFCTFEWDHRPIDQIAVSFSATGNVSLKGTLGLVGKRETVKWEFPKIFYLPETARVS